MNIVLIGYRCTGKTAVGKVLAKELGRDFLDTDALIEERAEDAIENIISIDGWARFRDIERRLIEEVSRKDNLVIATGGGVVTNQNNVEELKRNGWVVWLKADAEVIRDRMEKEHRAGLIRPSLTGSDPMQEIEQVLAARTPLYQQAADVTVDTTILSAREAAAAIMRAEPKA